MHESASESSSPTASRSFGGSTDQPYSAATAAVDEAQAALYTKLLRTSAESSRSKDGEDER